MQSPCACVPVCFGLDSQGTLFYKSLQSPINTSLMILSQFLFVDIIRHSTIQAQRTLIVLWCYQHVGAFAKCLAMHC